MQKGRTELRWQVRPNAVRRDLSGEPAGRRSQTTMDGQEGGLEDDAPLVTEGSGNISYGVTTERVKILVPSPGQLIHQRDIRN